MRKRVDIIIGLLVAGLSVAGAIWLIDGIRDTLSLVFVCLTLLNWPVAFVLARAAWPKPRIAALTERAMLAVAIATVTTLYSLLYVNTYLHIIDLDTARFVARLSVIAVGVHPVWWLWLYRTNRFSS